jgi:hypothetical protein
LYVFLISPMRHTRHGRLIFFDLMMNITCFETDFLEFIFLNTENRKHTWNSGPKIFRKENIWNA